MKLNKRELNLVIQALYLAARDRWTSDMPGSRRDAMTFERLRDKIISHTVTK